MNWDDAKAALIRDIEAAPNDWIACGLYLGWRHGVEGTFYPGFPESASDFRGLAAMERRIEEEEEYSFFRSELYRLRANRLNKERKIDEAIKLYDLAIKLAEEHEACYSLQLCLTQKANLVKRFDIDEALIILEKLRSITEEYGLNTGMHSYHQELAHIAMARGEFNLAVHHQIKRIQVFSELGWPEHELGYNRIALIHNMMGDGAKALELLSIHKESVPAYNQITFIAQAWAMANLGNVNDAESEILKAKEIILKSDNEPRLGLVYLVEGLIEKAQQDFANATLTLERALDIFERYLNKAFLNIALINLCDIEIETLDYDKRDKKVEGSGPWMTRLEEYIDKNDLPAIEGYLKLLKAKFLYKMAEVKESQKLVSEVREISKSQSMEYLEDVAKVLLPEIRK
jgi:tetratricopeptide (TPR) repeat protein